MSVRIPRPSLETEDIFPIAFLTGPDGNLNFHWWTPHRSVIVQIAQVDTWYILPDCMIRDSLADMMECDAHELVPDALYITTTINRGGNYLERLPEKMVQTFLDCEWSDFACDRRPIVGHIVVRPTSVQTPHSDDEIFTLPVFPRARLGSYK